MQAGGKDGGLAQLLVDLLPHEAIIKEIYNASKQYKTRG